MDRYDGVSRQNRILDCKERILTLLVSHPESSLFAIRHFLTHPTGKRKLAILILEVGVPYARQVLEGLSEIEWEEVLLLVAQESGRVHGSAKPGRDACEEIALEALNSIHRALVAERMTSRAVSSGNGAYQVFRDILAGNSTWIDGEKDPWRVAVLSAFLDPDSLTRMLESFPSGFRKQVILQISRLERIPIEAVKMSALNFLEELAQRPRIGTQLSEAPTAELSVPIPEFLLSFVAAPDSPVVIESRAPFPEEDSKRTEEPDFLAEAIQNFNRNPSRIREQRWMRFLHVENPTLFRELSSELFHEKEAELDRLLNELSLPVQ